MHKYSGKGARGAPPLNPPEGARDIMGRPKLSPDKKRDERMIIRFTLERVQLEELANSAGLSVPDYVRCRTLNKRLPARAADRADRAKLATALLRIGVNLNQVSKYANMGKFAPALLDGVLLDIRKYLDKLMEEDSNS